MNLPSDDDTLIFDQSAREAVNLGNQVLEDNPEADEWEVASGVLAGAIQFWLYTRQPCDDPLCESCSEINTSARRLVKLLEETREFAEDSDYYHAPTDTDVGSA